MVTHGLLVRLDAQHGLDGELENFLRSAQALVRGEPGTTAWFAVRFGRGEYGIFDVFPNEAARAAHLAGAVAAGLMGEGKRLLASPPRIERVDILASKLPATGTAPPALTRGLLLTVKAKQGQEAKVAEFLRGAQPLVQQEAGTVAWFALHLESGEYSIFDAFPDNGARFAHLTGQVPRELTKHAMALLGGFPDMDMLQVLASHFAA